MNTEIKYRPITQLHKLENNPRDITDADFQSLCDSIRRNKKYFEARALLLSDRTGKLVVIAGNQRYDAAEYLGMKEVPTILISGLTIDEEREIAIRDNVNNGRWNMQMLNDSWNDLPLQAWGVDIPEFEKQDPSAPDIKEVELTAYKKTHVLLSFPPERMIDIQELLEKIKAVEGIEYEQASN